MSKRKSFLIILSAKGGGDRPPVIALACALKERGHRVTVLCDEESAQQIASTKFPAYTFPPGLDERGHITRWFEKLGQAEVNPDIVKPPFITPKDLRRLTPLKLPAHYLAEHFNL